LRAYGEVFAFDLNVEFDVFILACVFPRVFAMFHFDHQLSV